MNKVTPFLMYNGRLEEAMNLYGSIFPDFKIINSSRDGGKMMSAVFLLGGHEFHSYDGGTPFKFSMAFSLSINCANQNEVDFYWDKLIAGGGAPSRCGWLTDKFGLSWQVIPEILNRGLQSTDAAVRNRVMNAMLKMDKLIVADLEAAFKG